MIVAWPGWWDIIPCRRIRRFGGRVTAAAGITGLQSRCPTRHPLGRTVGAPPFRAPHLHTSENALEFSEHKAQRLPRYRVQENEVVVGIATTPTTYFIR